MNIARTAIAKGSAAVDGIKSLAAQIKGNAKAEVALHQSEEALKSFMAYLATIPDTVAGTKIMEQAQQLHDKQRQYNDVLATRLAEALERIDKLEKRLDKVEAGHGC